MPFDIDDRRITSRGNFTVWIYYECDILSNVLIALARFRRRLPDRWPSAIQHHPDNLLSFSFGDDTDVGVDRAWLRDAIFISTHAALEYDAEDERDPTIFDGERTPIEDDGYLYVMREDLWE